MTRVLKICMVTPHFSPKLSGMAISTFETAMKLSEMGCEVHMVVPYYSKRSNTEDGLCVHEVEHHFQIPIDQLIFNYPLDRVLQNKKSTFFFYRAALNKVRKIVKRFDLNVIHLHSSFSDNYVAGYFAVKVKEDFRKISTILTIHGGGRYLSNRESATQRTILNSLDKIIVVSNGLRKEFLSLGVLPSKMTVIPNGIDLKKFEVCRNGSGAKTNDQRENKQPVILFGGRLDPDKGVTYLLSAFIKVLRELPDVKLFLAGSGCVKDFIKEIVVKLRLQRSTIIESFSYEDMPAVYAAADVVVVPSVQRDACPMAILEAMASRKPVVATNVPSITEIVTSNDTGLLVSPKDSHQLANAIVKLLTDRKLALSLAEKGYKLVKKCYDINSTSKQIISVYQEALESNAE